MKYYISQEVIDIIKTNNIKYLVDTIQNSLNNKKRQIVLVGGNSRSGKSTLSKTLLNELEKLNIATQIIELDNWILSVEDRTEDMDVFGRFNASRIEQDFIELLEKGYISIDAYDCNSRGRKRINKSITLLSEGVIIIEGVIALGINTLVQNSENRIFVSVDEKIRKKRFVEFYKLKQLNEIDIEGLYQDRLKDEFLIVEKTRTNAKIIFEGQV